jgi:hypothetical protein
MDHRRRTRVPARKQTTLTWSSGECSAELVNLSLKGCLLGRPSGLPPEAGQEVAVRIHLDVDSPDLDVQVHARVVRQDRGGIAVDFTEVELESFRHLFRLVQYNAPDPEFIEEELSTSAFNPLGEKSA